MAAVPATAPTTEPTTVAPVDATAAPVAPAAEVAPVAPAEVVEPKVEEPVKAEDEVAAPAAAEEKVEEKKEETKVEKPVEPIHSGALGYKAPGLKNAFRYSKKYFWFGEEAVSTQSLSHYLRGEKAEVAHPTAAWSSQTGKGLLYFVKHADEKATPAGVLNLAEAENLVKDGTIAFHFKLHGQKHAFEAQTATERNGWFVAFEEAVKEAKAQKETIVASEGYKEELSKLGKPAALVATAAKESSTPKKSTDGLKPTEEKPAEATEPVVAEGSTPARAGSSSSSSSDEEKEKKKKSKSKSRSVSRGKRASIFGGFLGKKEKAEEKKEEKKEGELEAKEETVEPTPAAATEASPAVVAPVVPATEEAPKPAEETKVEEPVAAAPVVAEEKKVEEKPKPAKRASIFGNFVEKLKSPTTEKKESEAGLAAAPAVPPKETEVAAEAPKIEEIPAVAAPVETPAEAATEAPKEEKKEEVKPAATTPHKEKQHFSFGKFLGGTKEKVKSPSEAKNPLEVAKEPKVEEPVKTEEPVAPVVEAPKTEETPAAPVTEAPKEETPAEASSQPKRGSIFGKVEGLFRNASKAGRSKKEKEPAAHPAKVEEAAEPKEETPATETPAVATEEKKEETPAAAATTEPTTIGDVVPDAVTVGQAPKSAPQVSTTA